MRNWWIRFGCFLTGFNYTIVRNSSEITAKMVKKYTSAMVIISFIWAFIGYSFTNKYLHQGLLGSIVGACIFCLIIVNVERQIILSVSLSGFLKAMRISLGVLMAFLGAVILDQIIFKDDVELAREDALPKKVNLIFQERAKEFKSQISYLDSAIEAKDRERAQISSDIIKSPTIPVKTSSSSSIPIPLTNSNADGKVVTRVVTQKSTSQSISAIENPKIRMLQPIDDQLKQLYDQKQRKESKLLSLQKDIEDRLRTKAGFLDELILLMTFVFSSGWSIAIYFLWFLILLAIEMLVVASKIGEGSTDYDNTIMHQMEFHNNKLAAMQKLSERN